MTRRTADGAAARRARDILEIFSEAQKKGCHYDPAMPEGRLTDLRKLRAGLPKAQWALLDGLTVQPAVGKAGVLVGLSKRSARTASGFLEKKGLVERSQQARPDRRGRGGGSPEWLAHLTEKGWRRLIT